MGYYSEKLAGVRLRRCYDIAPPRIKRYLEAEIVHLLSRLSPGCSVLELGCGYGRVAFRLAEKAGRIVGIDNAPESVALANAIKGPGSVCEFLEMDATAMDLGGETFDLVACVQNGICAFGADKELLMREAVKVARPGGAVIFSSYSGLIWEERLRWFEMQAAAGLIGAIDRERTGAGVIVCRDGFRSDALDEGGFAALCGKLGFDHEITTVDGSSVMCEIAAPGR